MKKLLYLAIVLLFQAGICFAQGPMPHVLDKASALALARAQGKFVLVVQGNASCGNCAVFEGGTLTSIDTNAPVKYLLEEAFIYWYCDSYDYYTAPCNTEIFPYNNDIIKQGYDLPLSAIIDPNKPEKYSARITGAAGPQSFYDCSLNYVLNMAEGPLFSNLKDGDSVKDPNFTVQGRGRWDNMTIYKVGVKINSNAWTSVRTTRAPNSPSARKNPVLWSYQLNRSLLRKGNNTIEIRSESSPYGVQFISPTRKVSFTYDGP